MDNHGHSRKKRWKEHAAERRAAASLCLGLKGFLQKGGEIHLVTGGSSPGDIRVVELEE